MCVGVYGGLVLFHLLSCYIVVLKICPFVLIQHENLYLGFIKMVSLYSMAGLFNLTTLSLVCEELSHVAITAQRPFIHTNLLHVLCQ